jgi:biotin carboxylase
MNIEAVKAQIAEFHRGKKWILLPDAAAAATQLVDQLNEWGVTGVMVIAAVEGAGDLPKADRFHYTRTSGDTHMRGIRAYLKSVEHPSALLIGSVEVFDPGQEAAVLGGGFSRLDTLAGRLVYGARPEAWGALEDKTSVDQLWDDAGVRRVPSVVVPVSDAVAASLAIESESGSVWVADNTEGWHGGGEYLRWIKTAGDAVAAIEWFSSHAEKVRVMPFLDGIPCSIHGFVTRDGVAVFNPVEMVILRHAEKPEITYAQAANFWNPPTGVRDEMRTAARRVGELLQERHGYLGGFGIDGVCTRDGFLPTEVNPRLSVGHSLQSRAAGIPLGSIERMLIEGDLDIEARDLEETIVSAASTSRRGGMLLPLTATHNTAETGIRFGSGRAIAVDVEGESDAKMEIGQASMGPIVILKLDPDRTPIGPSVAPRAIQAIDLARELWGIEVPPLEAAPDLCREVESRE